MMSQSASSGGLQFVVTNTLIVRDIQRSVAFYPDVLGAMVCQRTFSPARGRRCGCRIACRRNQVTVK